MAEANIADRQDDIVDHELLAAHDEITRLRQQLDNALIARDAIARDFLAASQAEERARRERDAAEAESSAASEALAPLVPDGHPHDNAGELARDVADLVRDLTRQRDDARSAGEAYKRDRDRWKEVAAAHGCGVASQ